MKGAISTLVLVIIAVVVIAGLGYNYYTPSERPIIPLERTGRAVSIPSDAGCEYSAGYYGADGYCDDDAIKCKSQYVKQGYLAQCKECSITHTNSEFKIWQQEYCKTAQPTAQPTLPPDQIFEDKGIVAYGSAIGTKYVQVELGDIDLDGDLDMLALQKNGAIYYFEYTGGEFKELGFTKITNIDGFSLADIDKDGDLDIVMVTEGPGAIRYAINKIIS